jgi:SNF2 family DNA or RNA helicase
MDHQKATAEFLTFNDRAFVLSEQGTGKTMSAIWAADFLMRNRKINRVLIVCPLSVMKSAWYNDMAKILIGSTIGVCIGTRQQKEAVIKSGAQYVLVAYDSVPTVQKTLARGGFDLIIADEVTYVKTAKAQRSSALQHLVAPHVKVWGMTGTPIAQSPMDAHGQLMVVRAGSDMVPRSMSAFRALVMTKNPYDTYGWTPKPDATDLVYKLMQPAIRFTKEECLDLPERTYQMREVEMTTEQAKHYNKLKKDGILKLKEGVVTAVNAGVLLSKLLQAASGTVYTETGEVVEFDNSSRLDEMKSIIDGTSHKVLVFCMFKHSVAQVCNYLSKAGISWDVIHGGITGNKRGDVVNRFQNEKDPKVLVIQPKAASHGITLTAADTVIWFNPVLSSETYLQANDRIHRHGQRNPCTVYHLVGCDVEKKAYTMLDKKIASQDNLLEMFKELVM